MVLHISHLLPHVKARGAHRVKATSEGLDVDGFAHVTS